MSDAPGPAMQQDYHLEPSRRLPAPQGLDPNMYTQSNAYYSAIPSSSTAYLPSHPRDLPPPDSGYAHPCRICGRRFLRKAGSDRCQNQHLGSRPYMCTGKCGDENCTKTFACRKQLSKHDRPPVDKVSACRFCQRLFSRQNLSRHEDYCYRRDGPSHI
ncbi:hypothetical protein CPB86DRAFT_200570 [Serendipita vermifera]|nr:hypothetical protein CPB86DRAFT_200570 [Serendipita vermifera]